MRIAILSDTHNNWQGLESAISDAEEAGCEVIFFAGDLCIPKGVGILAQFPGPVHQVVGNMDRNIDSIWGQAEETDNVIFHGEVCDIGREGVRIFMNHYPEQATRRVKQPEYDLCIHGHTHQFRDEQIDGTRVINPGALTDRGSQPAWATYDTQTGTVTQHTA